jgi:hypothetical protein
MYQSHTCPGVDRRPTTSGRFGPEVGVSSRVGDDAGAVAVPVPPKSADSCRRIGAMPAGTSGRGSRPGKQGWPAATGTAVGVAKPWAVRQQSDSVWILRVVMLWDRNGRGQPPMVPDEAVIGCTGLLLVGTRGTAGPGEVLVRVRGGSETFLAWSPEPLVKGTPVLVIESRGSRQVDVVAWADPVDPLDALTGDPGDAR